MNEWNVGLAPWILEDGNYPDFYRGQVAVFALSISPTSGKITPHREKLVELISVSDCRYRAGAEIVFQSDKVWVLDFGILAYYEPVHRDPKVPPGSKIGDYLEIEFLLGIDCFFYTEFFHKLPGMLALIYTWHLNKVLVQSAPRVGKWNATGQHWHGPDESNYSYREVTKTGVDLSESEEEVQHRRCTVSMNYILKCTQLATPPTFSLHSAPQRG